jgi:hypothetical protein
MPWTRHRRWTLFLASQKAPRGTRLMARAWSTSCASSPGTGVDSDNGRCAALCRLCSPKGLQELSAGDSDFFDGGPSHTQGSKWCATACAIPSATRHIVGIRAYSMNMSHSSTEIRLTSWETVIHHRAAEKNFKRCATVRQDRLLVDLPVQTASHTLWLNCATGPRPHSP